MSAPNGSGSPVEYPKVTIGSEVLTVKLGLLAELILSRVGLSFQEAFQLLSPGEKDARKFDITMQLFAACVAENYPPGQAPNADAWAIKIEKLGGDPKSNAPMLQAIYSVLGEAVTKRWPLPPKAQEPVADPMQPDSPKAN